MEDGLGIFTGDKSNTISELDKIRLIYDCKAGRIVKVVLEPFLFRFA